MRALVLDAPKTPFRQVTLPDPEPGPGEAVARVIACGAGLTIQHTKAGRSAATFPRIIGHEITGEIVALGAGVTDLAVGTPVTIHFYMFCGHCRECLSGRESLCENLKGQVGKDCDGGYAEYMKLPVRNYVPLPEALDYKAHPEEIGVIADALATPYKVLRRGRVQPHDWVAVFGAGGGLGIHQIMMTRWGGARVIAIDVASVKLDACRKAGADAVVDASKENVVEALAEITGGHGVDVAIDYVASTATLNAGIEALGRRGRLVVLGGAGLGSQIALKPMMNGEKEVLRSRYASRSEIIDTLDIVARGEIWPMVTDIRPMEVAEDLHALLEAGAVIGRAALRIA